MSKQQYILAIDQGTTSSRVIIFDESGDIHSQAGAEFAQHYPKPGWVEHDAVEIWDVTRRVMDEALAQAKLTARDIAAIGITNQRETVVFWDRQTGEPIGHAIVWQDRRTASLCQELREEGLEPDWQQWTGLLIDPYFSATKVAWRLAQDPALRARAQAGEIAFGTIDSWLVWNLTGGRRHVTDITNASRTLLFNIRECRWEPRILQRLDIPEAILPAVVPSSSVIGETDPALFHGHTIPIAGIAGDQQAALFGQACTSKGLAKNTYGTGSFVLFHTGTEPVMSRQRMLTTVAWQIGHEPVEYALEGAIFVTGAAIQWLRDGLGIIQNASETEALARSVESNDGVYFVPALTGMGAPHWNPDARGLVCGLTRGTTRAHIVRAALESIAYQTADVIDAMCKEAGIGLTELRADGGASMNSFLMQFQADILNVPVDVPVIHETTALGAALLAGLAVGVWPDRATLAARWKLAQRYEQQMAAETRQQLRTGWHQALARTLQGWSRIPDLSAQTA
jgi:glycerol kinase